MKAEIWQAVQKLWQEHTGAVAGTSLGVLLAIAILVFGFWCTIFVVFLGLLGFWLGREYDCKADAITDLREMVDNLLPERFLHLKKRDRFKDIY